ncbi:site-2 protease family protein [Numidum massiliense]|uniref:site-2 protease family protein n=1 Tax=Numidum massiliense TaxID=1522315 RepID=UPI000A5AB9E3|nr:site-2 protease family protein [Numidum massiliense]
MENNQWKNRENKAEDDEHRTSLPSTTPGPEREPDRNRNAGRQKGFWKWLGGIGAIIVTFITKLKSLLPLLKLGKFGGTIWSMALMIGAYATFAPWTMAIGIAVMIFIHEMGHVLAARRLNIPVSAPTFIPFLGALISMKKQPQNARGEAYLAMGGPLLGTVGALVCYGLAEVTGYTPLYGVALIGFFLNLINLLPIHPLDGGRIVTAISRWLWLVGLIGGLAVIIYLRSVLFFIIWALFAWELVSTFLLKRKRNDYVDRYRKTFPDVEVQRFTEVGVPVPAEQHVRQLPYTQYCDVATKQQLLAVAYPGIGVIGRFPFDEAQIEKVELVETKQASPTDVQMTVTIYCPHNPDKYPSLGKDAYYDVPLKSRILFGIGYFGLAALLVLLLYAVNVSAQAGNVLP